MYSIIDRIMSVYSKPEPEVSKCIYTERIKCFEKLAEIQKNLKTADDEHARISGVEGEPRKNVLNRMEVLTKEYKKEYELCEKIMKY